MDTRHDRASCMSSDFAPRRQNSRKRSRKRGIAPACRTESPHRVTNTTTVSPHYHHETTTNTAVSPHRVATRPPPILLCHHTPTITTVTPLCHQHVYRPVTATSPQWRGSCVATASPAPRLHRQHRSLVEAVEVESLHQRRQLRARPATLRHTGVVAVETT